MTNTRTCGTQRQHAAAVTAAACTSLACPWHSHMLGGAGSPP
jgi:hypothetical protein